MHASSIHLYFAHETHLLACLDETGTLDGSDDRDISICMCIYYVCTMLYMSRIDAKCNVEDRKDLTE